MEKGQVIIIDGDAAVCDALKRLLKSDGIAAHIYSSAEEFIQSSDIHDTGCLLLDMHLPGISGLQLLEYLRKNRISFPAILMTGDGDVETAVNAMKKGARDFIVKPFDNKQVLESVKTCLLESEQDHDRHARQDEVLAMIAKLTKREHEVMNYLMDGNQNKQIAKILGISHRTVELHRAKVMEKLQANTLSGVVRLGLTAGLIDASCDIKYDRIQKA